VRQEGGEIYLATPRIQKASEVGYFKLIERAEPDGVLLRNLGSVDYFQQSDFKKVGDFSLNVSNPITARLLKEHGGFDQLTISYDLNEGQVCDLLEKAPAQWFELTLHQNMPMFHMEHCVFCTFMSEGTSVKDCGKPCEKHSVQLRDRVGQLHYLAADVGCRNTLFNGQAQTGAASVRRFSELGLRSYRLEFLNETALEAGRLVTLYRDFLADKREVGALVSELGVISRLGVTEGTLEQRRAEAHR